MADENLYAFLARRDRELVHQIAAIKDQLAQMNGQLAQREHELSEVRRMRAAATLAGSAMLELPPRNSNSVVVGSPHPYTDASQPGLALRSSQMTIKELVIKALLAHFPNGGTAIDIRDFIQDAYGRDVLPSSLRPQMHRLKAAGILGQEPSTDTWNFQDGKRELYMRYSPPVAAMKELQDDDDSGHGG